MKRDAYGDDRDGPYQKRQRYSDDEVTFLIPSKVAGSIIGKGGTNISKLRNQVGWLAPTTARLLARSRRAVGYSSCSCRCRRRRRPPRPAPCPPQYKASITVPDCPGPERVLTISAPDIDTVLEIVKDILPSLADGGGPKGSSSDELDIRLMIHQSRAGCVIGKAGSKIKELREKTGARLKIFSNPAPQSTERVVLLVGKPDSIIAAIREVLELVRDVPIKGSVQNYDPHNYDDFYAEEYGGFGLGPGRGRAPPPRRAPPPPPRGYSGPPPPRGNFSGPPRGNFPPPSSGNFSGNYNNRGGPNNFSGNGPSGPGQQETSTQVTIPKDLAGAIIGKAGTRIRKIRLESGAAIEIAEPLPGAPDRIITITGAPHRIQVAQYLLQQSVHESNPNLGRGNNF